jgi:tricorn protease
MKRLLLFLFLIIPVSLSAAGNLGYYRFPAIHDDMIVFTAEGDLWVVGAEGGMARRLTTHHGQETNAEISPDGSLIAFSAQYEGPTEIYTIPVTGGLPVRRTFEGETALVSGWTPDGKILYSTYKYSTLPNMQLAAIDLETGKIELVPLAQASDGAYGGDGALYFTRLPFQGSQTKRYTGGTAQNLWKFGPGKDEAVPLTADYTGTSKVAMWWNSRVYFVTDRDGTMNIWSMDETGRDLRQHTTHSGWDIHHPSLHNGRIVYQRVADLFIYDIEKDKDSKLNITLASDFDQTRERWVKDPVNYMTSLGISSDASRIVMTARGLVFTAPVKEGRLIQATRKNSVRYRNASFMPDGKSILALSDESGELEFVKLEAGGSGKEETLTSDGKVFRYAGIQSPDGKYFVYDDKDYELWLYDVEKKKNQRIATSDRYGFYGFAWSPDSRWLAYVVSAGNLHSQIMLYNLDTGKITAMTTDRVDSESPVWSPDGEWIYFLSDRNFRSLVRSPWGPRQPEPFFDKTSKIYMTALKSGLRSPFLPDDEVYLAGKDEKKDGDDKKADKKDKKEKDDEKDKDDGIKVEIELEGLVERTVEVPVPAGAYSSLKVNDKALFVVDREITYQGDRNLKAIGITNDEIEAKTLLDGITGYDISGDGKKLLVRKGSSVYVIDASTSPPSKLEKDKVDLSAWNFSVIPREEWRQMFIEAWRLERDFFYDPDMHGVDYNGLLERHLPLVDRVTDRDELNDLIAHLVGELSALHTFVFGGDRRSGEDQVSPASLGARLVRDEKAGGYGIDHIYLTEPDYPEFLSPLARPEVRANEGDIITAINGVSILSVEDPAVLLKNQANRQVLLTIIPKGKKESLETIVKPITARQESNLRYNEWEYSRRMIVEKAGDGEIGYVHLRAMGGDNYSEWVRNFYPVFDRKGLIIDVRHNRGGNIDSWILEKLIRQAWFYWKPRKGEPTWNMQYAFRGHIVVLCNERTASDGEAFTEGFMRLGLGKVIGTRTWGGEIWLSMRTWLADRGMASAAETGVYGPEGEWLIEGHGVDPDIIVDNLPYATFKGKDAQLDAAIKHLKELIKKEPVDVPDPPEYPDKSHKYE